MIYHFFCKNCSNSIFIDYKLLKSNNIQCELCGHENEVLDISYQNNESAALSNLFPHKFIIDGVMCQSMESFIQSLRVEDSKIQKKICEDYSGYMAYKMRLSLEDWRKTGYIFWQGKIILRNSEEYKELITKAYDALYSQNIVFRHCLSNNKDKILIHSTGCCDTSETLLTEQEYIFQLDRLVKLLDY